jgi:branched-chain amino acid transport system ATP-binding protein
MPDFKFNSKSEAILETRCLVRRFGALVATDDLSLRVNDREMHAIIGPNGAGKTTLIAQLAGELTPTAGQIFFAAQDITNVPMASRAKLGIVRSFQITSLCCEYSAVENVALAVQGRQGHSFGMWQRVRSDRALLATARGFLEMVGLALRTDVPAGLLAHGEQRQLEVAVALACQPRVLLLDEPMAGMGRDESLQMIRLLKSLKGRYSTILVEHDMDAVFALADRITVLVYGGEIATGVPEEIATNPLVRSAYLGDGSELRA